MTDIYLIIFSFLLSYSEPSFNPYSYIIINSALNSSYIIINPALKLQQVCNRVTKFNLNSKLKDILFLLLNMYANKMDVILNYCDNILIVFF